MSIRVRGIDDYGLVGQLIYQLIYQEVALPGWTRTNDPLWRK